tara:strand:- start:1327 stop:2697 length:1371 start_codon:yes stop_codon:yes gene_type:complete
MIKWERKYSPKSIKEIIGHKKELIKIKKWIIDFVNEVPKCKKVLLITGNSGIGKSVIARCILNDFGYRPIEHMCDDIKGKSNIYNIIKQSLVYNNVMDCFNENNKQIGLILDQINILTEGGLNKNGFNDILNILKFDVDNIKKYKKIKDYIYIYNPIICICEKLNTKIKKLLKYSVHIHLDDFDEIDLKNKINPILIKENINITDNALNYLMKYANNDYRRFINLLEELHDTNLFKEINIQKLKEFKDIHSYKNKKYILNESINDIMTHKMNMVKSTDIFYNDNYMIPYYLYDTYLLYIKNYEIDKKDKINIYSKLLESSCEYEYFHNQLDNKYDTDFIYYSHYCSYIPNFVCSKYKLKKDVIDEITFPKLYTNNASKYINKKYTEYNFNNLYLINLIHFHLFNENGNKKKLLKYLKNNNITNIDKIIKYKKLHISFKNNDTNNITKNIINNYLLI